MKIPFDQYQRYKMVQQLIFQIKGKNSISILEVGANEHKNLEKFLPDDDITYIDINVPEYLKNDSHYIKADATCMPFEENRYDVAIALDVYEHIPVDKRKSFLDEIDRVSKKAFIIAGPFNTEMVLETEKRVNEYFKSIYGQDYIWLEEHIKNKLPDLDKTKRYIKNKEIKVMSFSHGSLYLWEKLIRIHFSSTGIPSLCNYRLELDEFYNENLFANDYKSPCYRNFVIGTKESKYIDNISQLVKQINSSEIDAIRLDKFLELEKSFYELESRKIKQNISKKQEEVLSISRETLNEQEEKIKSMEKSLKEYKDSINILKSSLNKIYNSNGWKFLLKYYKFRDKINAIFKINSSENITGNIYYKWIKKNEPNNIELKSQKSKRFNYEPKISIVVPTFNTPKQFLIDMIESVIKQTYPNWELCISDGGSYEKYITEIIKRYQDKYKNIKFNELNENRGIAGNSNAALQLTTGDFVALLDHDDILPPNALFEIVKIINEKKDVDFIYTDEDKISENSKKRFDPHFKPDWGPDTLKSYNYICHLSVIKKSLLDKIGGFREGFNGSQDYDLILRATEKAKVIFHIPKILYHWRVSDKSVAKNPNAKMYCYESAKKALKSHLNRLNIDANVKDGLFLGSYKIEYKMSKTPKVSIIIPNKDHVEDLGRCINSIISKSNYKNYEIIIVENNSIEDNTFRYYEKLKLNNNIKVVKWDSNGRFNYSAINNYGVKYADGEVILLLNNDVKVINSDWIERMLEHVMRKEVGAVGAKLYYPDDTIQHAGVILGMGGIAGHVHRCLRKNTYGYFGRTHIIQNLSAVTGACLMIRKEIFEEVNGLDEKFKVAFNDIDLCSKIRQLGKLVIWTPYAELYHYESKSRGAEDTIEKQKRFNGEIELFKKKWGNILKKGDPYYNPNLTLDKEDFSINLK